MRSHEDLTRTSRGLNEDLTRTNEDLTRTNEKEED